MGTRLMAQDMPLTSTRHSDIVVRPVAGRRELNAFIRLPKAIYADDPAWIAPLELDMRMRLSKKQPYFRHAEGEMFIAWRGGEPVGRITAQIDRLHLQRYDDATGFFGFLEARDDPAIFRALLGAAAEWLRARGQRRMRGPFSWSINQESGLLVKGFDTPPAVMMGHARPWHGPHVEAAGLKKAMDLIAYDFHPGMRPPEKMRAFIRRLKDKGELTVRPLNRKRFNDELNLIMDIFNDAWADNWGFIPFTEAEIRQMAQELRLLVEDHDVAIAEWKGEPAAMTVVMPDINRLIADFHGRLLPFNWLKFIWRLKFSGAPKRWRMPLMGVRKRFQNSLTGAALALAVIEEVNEHHHAKGFAGAELSWILETNTGVRKIIESIGAIPYKTYRIYETDIA